MFAWGAATRIYLAAGATHLRKGFDGLYALVRQRLEMDPLSGHVFVFANRARKRLKLIYWDGSGLWLCAKRLECGRFHWPQQGQGKLRLSAEELALLVRGLDLSSTQRRAWFRPHPARQQLPQGLPRRERVLACPPEQRRCPVCGSKRVVIGYDTSEQLDVEPARYYVLVIKRDKRACPRCPAAGVVTAPLPPRIVERALVSDQVVVNTVVAKYVEHMPLYRQSAKLAREVGLAIRRATLDAWVMRVGELVTPVTVARREELLATGYIQADETPPDVQMHDGRGRNGRAVAVESSAGPGGLRLPAGPQPGWAAPVSGWLSGDLRDGW